MRLDDLDPSDNARDLGTSGGGFGGGGGGGLGGLIGLLPLLLGRRMGCGTIAIIGIIALFVMFSGGLNLGSLGGGGTPAPSAQKQASGGNVACDTAEERFACQVLTSTEQTWGRIFRQSGSTYPNPTLNFFRDQNQSGCGAAQAAMGPFYCPADQGIYLDTNFFNDLSTRFGAAGDFAQAYVIAHEVGHHVQTVTGISKQVREAQQRASRAEGNALQVRMELQADCYSGVWAAQNKDRIEPGDIEEGLRAASAIGDDTLQKSAGQRPVPESFTHGTSEQRMRWLKRGLDTGDANQCDTFAAKTL